MVSEKKKPVEEVSGWLRVFDDGSVDRRWTGPPEVQFMVKPVAAHDEFVDGVSTKDVIADKSSGLRVRIYLPEQKPENNDTKLPIILHFHGGGFCISQADWYMYYHIYTKLSRSTNAVVISVYQRLAPEHRLPAAIEDGYSALLWLRSLARGEQNEPHLSHADYNRVFLIGDSSGGNIVHHVAAQAGTADLSPLRLAGGIPIHPGFVRAERSKSQLEQPQSTFLTLDMGPEAQPLGDLKLPPFLLCVASKDLLIDTEIEYFEAMKKANKDVELLINEGVSHSFYLNKIAVDMDPETAAETERLIAGIKQFIKNH
nr:PUCXE28 protein [Pyrus ussuriensis]